ncbi:putative pro-resilin [Iris pallida]|uniref:Pro-resilin n=1 Tax=Iris pallida TaxID=29817 RepID=A0AAX6HQA4_IRIPA|nr:putative pro-resilin [Iris pallida]
MASSRYEVEVTVASARDLKNVNWRNGELRPYAVLWIDDGPRCSTTVAVDGDPTSPVFDAKLVVPLPPSSAARVEDSVLHIDVVHARSPSDVEDVKPLVGSARIPLRDVIDEVGIGGRTERTLKLKRPSGRPQGKLEVKVAVREPRRYYDPYAAPAPYGQSVRDFAAPYGQPPYAGGYGGAGTTAPPVGYPYGAPPQPAPYGAPPQPAGYGGSSYVGGQYGGGGVYGEDVSQKKKKSGMGMGTGLAVGAAAGLLGGLALAEGVEYVEDKIAERVEEKIEDDLAYEDGGYDDF